MRNCIVYVLLMFFVGIGFAQDEKKDYSEAFKLIEVWLDAQKDFEKLPGISASIIKDQEVMWSGGFGMSDPENGVSTTANTLCSICSISKLFTAVAVMKLYDEGKLRLDDKVSDLLPWFNLKQQFEDSAPITVRSLLTHSSGLPREAKFPYWTGPEFAFPTSAQVRAELKNQETLYPAATYFQYSNLGLTLLGDIVSEVSGMPYDEYVKQNILVPLGLNDTRTHLPEALYGKQLAVGYTSLKRDLSREKVKLFQANGITPAAGFSSNVLDLGKFASWQFRLLDSASTEILRPATLKNMYSVHYTDPSWKTTWGLGFAVYKGADGNKWVSHGGSCPGYRSVLQINPKSKRAFAVMINANGTNPGKYASEMNKILNKVQGSEDDEAPKNLEQYTGYYSTMPWWSELYIGTWNGKLVTLDLPSDKPSNSMTLYKLVEGDTFERVRDNGKPGEALIFQRDASGTITGYRTHDNTYSKLKR